MLAPAHSAHQGSRPARPARGQGSAHLGEGEVRDGHVVQHDAKERSAVCEDAPDVSAHHLHASVRERRVRARGESSVCEGCTRFCRRGAQISSSRECAWWQPSCSAGQTAACALRGSLSRDRLVREVTGG